MSALPVIALCWIVLALGKLILTPPPTPPKRKTPEEKLSEALVEVLTSHRSPSSTE